MSNGLPLGHRKGMENGPRGKGEEIGKGKGTEARNIFHVNVDPSPEKAIEQVPACRPLRRERVLQKERKKGGSGIREGFVSRRRLRMRGIGSRRKEGIRRRGCGWSTKRSVAAKKEVDSSEGEKQRLGKEANGSKKERAENTIATSRRAIRKNIQSNLIREKKGRFNRENEGDSSLAKGPVSANS